MIKNLTLSMVALAWNPWGHSLPEPTEDCISPSR
jgi:hypothetical protein